MLLILTGCASMSPAERAWQTMHAIDMAQTLNGPASDPCYRETGLITSRVIGSQPEPAQVVAWGAAYAVAHAYAWQWIDRQGWPRGLTIALRTVDLANKVTVIGHNHRQGVRPFGDNQPCQ